MNLIFGKLNQTVPYKRRIGADDTGKPEYEPPVDIPCRLQDDRRMVLDELGREVVSETVLYTCIPVQTQDAFVLRGRDVPIIRVSVKVGLDGRFDHCEVRL